MIPIMPSCFSCEGERLFLVVIPAMNFSCVSDRQWSYSVLDDSLHSITFPSASVYV